MKSKYSLELEGYFFLLFFFYKTTIAAQTKTNLDKQMKRLVSLDGFLLFFPIVDSIVMCEVKIRIAGCAWVINTKPVD